MDSTLSAQQKKLASDLKALLKQHAHPFEKKDIKHFVKTVDKICNCVEQDRSGTTDLGKWDKIGNALQSDPRASVSDQMVWSKIRMCLTRLTPRNILLSQASATQFFRMGGQTPVTTTQPQSLTTGDIASAAASKCPFEQIDPEPPPLEGQTLPLGPAQQTLQQRDLSSTIAVAPLMAEEETIPSLYPVVRGHPAVGAQPAVLDRHQPLALEYIKALHKSVKMNGTQAPYTKVLLNNIAEQRLIPKDWDQLASGIFPPPPPGDLLLFRTEWRHLAVNKAQQNRTANINITQQMLVGEGHHMTRAQQIGLTDQALEQVAAIVIRAWTSLPQKGDPTSTASFASIRQGAKEPYTEFVTHLLTALERQIENEEARKLISKQLAYENANEDCKQALTSTYSRSNSTIADMVRLCQNIGTYSYKAQLIAAAINASPNPANSKNREDEVQGNSNPGSPQAQVKQQRNWNRRWSETFSSPPLLDISQYLNG